MKAKAGENFKKGRVTTIIELTEKGGHRNGVLMSNLHFLLAFCFPIIS